MCFSLLAERGIEAIPFCQGFMIAALNDASPLHDENLIGVAYG